MKRFNMRAGRLRRKRSAARKQGQASWRYLIPNLLTLLAFCSGVTAIRLAIEGRWETAVAAVIIAGVIDGFDGRAARLLNGQTRFGAELDSLSDVVAFGVAPALMMYLWSLHAWHALGWLLTLALAAACALRLARFNAQLDSQDNLHKRFGMNMGVPAPVGAGLALFPMYLMHLLDNSIFQTPMLCAFWQILVAGLMVSRIPTYTWSYFVKRWNKIAREWYIVILLLLGLYIFALISKPWITLTLMCLAYLLSVIVGIFSWRKSMGKYSKEDFPSG